MKTIENKSPFGLFENETLVKIEPTVTRSLFITDIEASILKALNKVIVSTSSLLFRQLQSHDDIPDQDTVKTALNKLWKSGYVEKFHFVNRIDNTYSAGKIYVLSYRARGYLKSVAITPNKTMYIQNILAEDDSAQVKRLLSAQQFALSYEADDFKIAEAVFVPRKNGNVAKYIFRPQAIINADNTLFIESVRNDDIRELDRVTEKLHRITEVCKKNKANINIKNPMVVLVAEDSIHMNYIKAELEGKLRLNINLMITNDLDVYYGKTELIDIDLQKPSFLDLFIERKAS